MNYPELETPFGCNNVDDGKVGWQMQGMTIAASVRIEKNRLGYKVPSQSSNGSYVVNIDGEAFCTCPDFEKRQQPCKHVYAVYFVHHREQHPIADEVAIGPEARPASYGQAWNAYNTAQTHERDHLLVLLREICDTVPQPPQMLGRPRLPISDVLFGIGLKVYSTMSGRRAMSDFRNAKAVGLFDKIPSFTSTFRYLENPDLAPLLKGLVELSALPLRSVETDFAIDSSGFSTSVYNRWFDHKWGRVRKEAQWVKAHLMCGVKTNIVTAVEVTATESADSPYLAPFVKTTARNFEVGEVSGDKAYLSKKNLKAVQDVGGIAYMPFKSNSTGHHGHHKRDALWERTFHYYNLFRKEFMAH